MEHVNQTSLPPAAGELKPETVALPPVKTILNALVWLAAKHRESPTRETLHAMASQARWLLMHPDARADDLISGLNLAGVAYHDSLLWLSAHAEMANAVKH
jgi:hypothetical protein